MKHLLLPMLLLASAAGAQLPYDLTVLDQPYTPLSEATALEVDQYDLGNGWDDPEFSVQLGFEFSFSGYTIDAWDQVGLGNIMAGTYIDGTSGLPLLQAVMPTGFDLTDRGLLGLDPSIIRWQTTGDPGSRVFSMEWANCGMYEEISDSVSNSYVNVQVRLFEASGAIEFHYGPSFIENPGLFEPAVAGIFLALDPFSYTANVYALDGDPTDPSIVPYGSIDEWYYGAFLQSHPADGTVYRWGPTGNTLDRPEVAFSSLEAWPNPTSGEIRVAFEGEHDWTLSDALGRAVRCGTANGGVQLELGGLDNGTYLFRLDDGRVKRLVRH